jgi:hypothetical protein
MGTPCEVPEPRKMKEKLKAEPLIECI